MTRRTALGALAAYGLAGLIVGLAPLPVSAQAPPRDMRGASPAPTGTAAISGTVVSAEGAKPVRLASVVIIGATTGVLRVTSSNADGRFAFANLPADRYVIGASRPPFLGSVAGARRPARSGTSIALSNDETVTDVMIRMPLGASIAGVITDERGQPGTAVLIGLQRWRLQGGERVLTPAPGDVVQTDDQGRYRIYGLPPGEYLVVAMRFGGGPARVLGDAEVNAALKGDRVGPAAPGDPGATYVPVYFPGTTRGSDATLVALTVGEDRQNVDLRLELMRAASVEGTVTTRDGQPPTGVIVALTTASPSNPLQTTRAARAAPDGSFKILNVPPGSYTLVAREGGGPHQFASVRLEVAGADQSGLQLTLGPPLGFSGRIAFEGTSSPAAMAGHRVSLRGLTPGVNIGATPQVGMTNSAGVFGVTGLLPGQYVLGGPLFFGATAGSVIWALQSVVVDGHDVTDLPLAITAESVPKDVVLTFGERWQDLSGRLRASSGAAALDYTIVLFPADKQYWLPGSRRILTTRPGTDGQFRLGGPGPIALPPGSYLLAAGIDLERDEQFDPAFLDSLVPAAVPLTVQPGERKVQDLIIK